MAAMNLAQARLLMRLGQRDLDQEARDALVVRSAMGTGSSTVVPTVSVSMANVAKDALTQCAWDKKTCEWKARATGGRKSLFTGAPGPLHDHNLDRNGQALGRRKQQSNYFMTINTNKRKFDDLHDPAAVEHAITVCFKKNVTQMLTFGPRHPATYADDKKWPDAVIEAVDVKAGVEIGPVTGALHAHLYLTITHWSQLQINIPILQEMFKQAYNEKAKTRIADSARPAIQISLEPQTDLGQIRAHYMTKQVLRDAGESATST